MAECEDGEEALRVLAAEAFDLVLLDIGMPGMSGTEVCRVLRTRPEGAALRIIAYTAHALPSETETIMTAGFDGLLIKPIDRKTLLRAVGLEA